MKTKHLMVPIGYTQFFASLLVILVHCGRLAENNGLHFLLKSLLCRLAVPFFLLLNGYFFQKSTCSWQQWCKRQLKLYLRWSIVYLPLGWFYLGQQNLADPLRVIGLAAGFLTVGVWYHLWYFPALLFGMWLVRKTRFLG
ncbi:acyltransferase family protein [Enterococcus entomosocium]|uniref:Acyltransferase family protein n=2 Tax=Enterococcus TaxID=1350 RepID=A0ABV3MFK1_9ENTE|nr:acyltransferase family protein [Enterococcus casseliflavus]MDB1708876.1 acyltransferase family protein [Enterococcus casseliflavus]MDB1717398.1 acyltransferase family protein [Enterococcus casseliflavus]